MYGARFPRAFESDDDWFAINRFGVRHLIGWSIPMIMTGILSFFLLLQSHTGLTLTHNFASLAFVLVSVVETWRFARRYQAPF
ncbi:MAG: hypothetical protein C0483_23225 [Pirellula sp.]|nr:hypothetical protein [Pirellula sp.]